jgi:hypothetical protein
MAQDENKAVAKETAPAKTEKLNKPKKFKVLEPFLYGEKPYKIGNDIFLDDVQTINNLTPKYIR